MLLASHAWRARNSERRFLHSSTLKTEWRFLSKRASAGSQMQFLRMMSSSSAVSRHSLDTCASLET